MNQPQQRVVGLNKFQRPRQLLKNIKGRPSQSLGPKHSLEKPSSLEMDRDSKEEDPEFITAPPLSSDDEEESQALGQTTTADPLDSDDDDNADYRLRRGDIRPTNFNKPPSSQAGNTQKSRRERTRSSSRYEKTTGDSRAKEPSSSSSSKRSVDEARAGMGGHLRDDYGFTRPAKKSKVKRSSTYGSQSRSSERRASQKSDPRSSAPKDNTTSPRKGFIQPSNSLSPECIKTTPKRQFRMREDSLDVEDAPDSRNAFKLPPPGPSPSLSPQTSAFKHATVSDDSPEKPKMKLFNFDKEELPPSSQRSLRTTKLKKSRNRGMRRAGTHSPIPIPEEVSQRPTFKMPELDESDIDNTVIQEAFPSQYELGDGLGNEAVIEETQVTTTARCPMCHEVVDSELLNRHSDHGRMSIKKQAAFCRMHNRKTALNSGSERGYPKIDWDTLDSRCDKHQEFLKRILEGSQPSHFGKVLQEQVQSGKNRTLLKTEDSLIPGYYGPRGLRVMTEYIMQTLSTVVRKRAVEDRLVSARGYTGYVQAVLVPELAVRLIMEDMGVPEESARETLHGSIKVGELLYEDAGDIIVHMSDEEDFES